MKHWVIATTLLGIASEIGAQSVSLPDSVIILHAVEVMASHPDKFTAGQKRQQTDSLILSVNQFSSLGELLSHNTPVQIQTYNYNGLSTISFRGTASGHTGVYWKGLPLNPSNTGAVDFSLIPAGLFNDVSLLYGGGSASFGSGNIGGSIHLDNKPVFRKSASVETTLKTGSFGERAGSLGAIFADQRWFSKTQVIMRQSENDFEYTNLKGEREKQQNGVVKQAGFLQDVHRDFGGKYKAEASFWYQSNHRKIPASLLSGQGKASQDDESVRVMAGVQRFFRTGKIEVKSGLFSDFFRYLDPGFTASASVESVISTTRTDTRAQYEWRASEQTVMNAGISYVHENGSSVNWNGEVTRETIAFFAMLSHSFPSIGWQASVNLRHSLTEGYDAPFTPSAGLEGRIWRFISARISASRNYRIPTFNERFWVPYGNKDLLPETSWNQEAGIVLHWKEEQKKRNAGLSVTVFNSNVDNWILWVPAGSYVRPENIREVWARGVELTANASVEMGRLTVVMDGGASFVRSTNEKTATPLDMSYKRQLIYVPDKRLYVNVSVGYRTYTIVSNYSYTGSRYITSDNLEWLPSFSTGNLSLIRDFFRGAHSFSLRFGVSNIWGEEYQVVAGYPMPGTKYDFAIRYRFNSMR